MNKTKIIGKSYVLYVVSNMGKRMWLSDMGSWVGGQYTFMWEPDFHGARQFKKMKDAKEVGLAATQQLPGIEEFYIAKRVEKSDGIVELQ
jgi:hypothetical protein